MLKVIIFDTLRSRQNREVKFGKKLEKRMLLNFPKEKPFPFFFTYVAIEKKNSKTILKLF